MRRVRRPLKHEELMKRLTSEEGPFGTFAEVLTFAAGLGFSKDRREPFTGTGEQIDFDVFQRLGVEGFIDMIAVTTHDDVAILSNSNSEERLTIFEEFANGGLGLLESSLTQKEQNLDGILRIILQEEGNDGSSNPVEVDFDAVVNELTS